MIRLAVTKDCLVRAVGVWVERATGLISAGIHPAARYPHPHNALVARARRGKYLTVSLHSSRDRQ